MADKLATEACRDYVREKDQQELAEVVNSNVEESQNVEIEEELSEVIKKADELMTFVDGIRDPTVKNVTQLLSEHAGK